VREDARRKKREGNEVVRRVERRTAVRQKGNKQKAVWQI
jgi:hypothetical protein